ncbi:hypothetical protein Bca101_057643 [Brassica carinata]
MSSSPVEKKDSDVEMGEASQASPVLDVHEATPSLIAGFYSFKERLSRRSATKGSNRDRRSGSSTAPIIISCQDDVVESAPPASKIVLGLPAPSAAPFPKGCSRAGATTGAKRKRCAKSEAGEPSGLLSQHRSKFVSLIDGMLGKCGSEVARLSKELESSQEALKRAEAALQTIENTHAAQMSQLEVRIGDLKHDLGKTASSLLKVKKEKKQKSSEVRSSPTDDPEL